MLTLSHFSRCAFPFALALSLIHTTRLQADTFVFVLNGGGQIEGDWLNTREKPRKTYLVKMASGGRIALDKSHVRELIRQRPERVEYGRIAPTFGDSVDEQWQLAEWCRERRLTDERDAHLRRIIELDPDHVKARYGLGYTQAGNEWLLRAEWQKKQGYVLYRGRWRTPQEVEVLEARNNRDRAEREWISKLKRFRSLIEKGQVAEARSQILDIRDKNAVRALKEGLKDEPLQPIKLLYVEALGQIESTEAVVALVNTSLNDPDKEIFHECLDQVVRRKPVGAVDAYIKGLKDANNVRVNRSAEALGELGDQESIGPMIDSLITTHQVVYGKPSRGGTPVTTSFASPGNSGKDCRQPGTATPGNSFGSVGMSSGNQTQVVSVPVKNQEVLYALVKLAGGTSYGFDQKRWKNWHALEKRKETQSLSSRAQ